MGNIIDLSTNLGKQTTDEERFTSVHFDTEIIRLQSYDNFYSLMDRLHQRDAAGQSSRRLLLVWPVRGQVLETPVEFGRLRGWAARNHYEIAVVIPGNTVYLDMAREQGISAFRSLNEAGSSEWQTPASAVPEKDSAERIRRLAVLKKDVERAHPAEIPFGIRMVLFLFTLFVLAFVFYAVFPQAKVEITPYLAQKSINMTIWTDERLDTPTLAGGIPTMEKRLDLTLSASVPSSGKVHTEPRIAIGEISVTNLCDRVYYSSAGVRVGTSDNFDEGVNFITLESLSLAPGETRIVRIEAENGGESGNLPESSIQHIEYPASLCWEIHQENPTEGGTSGIYATPTEADIKTAKEKIMEELQKAAAAALANTPEGQDLLTLGEASVTAVKQEQVFPEPGFASDTLTLRQTLEVSYKTVLRSDMEAIIRGQAGRMNMNMQDTHFLGYEILSGPTEENGLQTWSIRADYLVSEPPTNEEAIQIMLRGKSLTQAQNILDSLQHVKSSSITLLPSGLKHLPLTAQNIRVIIYPAKEMEGN